MVLFHWKLAAAFQLSKKWFMGNKAVVTPFPAHHLQLPLAMAHVPAVLATGVGKAGALRCDFIDLGFSQKCSKCPKILQILSPTAPGFPVPKSYPACGSSTESMSSVGSQNKKGKINY